MVNTLKKIINKNRFLSRIKNEFFYIIGKEINDRNFFIDKLKPSEVAIDCGANVGKITELLARRGAEIYAFEPNPYAYQELKKKFAGNSKVHCFQKGVYDRKGVMPLYLHNNAEDNQVKWSVGSSLLSFKGNVNKNNFIEIEVVDLIDFINDLHKNVGILKMDIEGAECEVINKLIDTGTIKKVRWLLAENHAERIPEITGKMARLKERIKKEKIKNINFNWE